MVNTNTKQHLYNTYKDIEVNPQEIDFILEPQDIMKIMKINRTKAYEMFNRSDFPSFKEGKSLKVQREFFAEWLRRYMLDKLQFE